MILAAALACAFAAPAAAQYGGFGQNHVVIEDFHWKIRSTEHFDIHYYEDDEPMVPAAAEILERSYDRISDGLGVEFKRRRPYFLYASVNHMEQSNITDVGDGTGGVTEAFKDRFMVYQDGSRRWLDDVTTHELTHVFQYAVLIDGWWRSARILKSIVYPLWWMEGMPEYFTGGLDDGTEEYYVRDAATSGRLIPLWKLEHFSHLKPHQVTLAYKSGATAIEFIATQYGKEKVAEMLKLFDSRFEMSAVLHDALGLDEFAFDRKWREWITEKYMKEVRDERLKDPSEYGVDLTTNPVDIPEFDTSPVFTPDGRKLAFLSTREGQPPIVVSEDLATGRRRRLTFADFTKIENIDQGRFTDINRQLAISPDGRTLVFPAQKNHRESLYFYDLQKNRLTRIPVPGVTGVFTPSFSPDGRRVVFSGLRDSITDLYMMDVHTRQLTRLTDDPNDDQGPVFSPDGKSVVYSSEILVPGDPMPYQRRLYRLDLEGLTTTRLLDLRGAAEDPMFSEDGRRILFSMGDQSFREIYELDLQAGRVLRLTRTIGGSFTPLYAPNGDVVFASFRRNNVDVYRARREQLLAEPVAAEFLPKGPAAQRRALGGAAPRLPAPEYSRSATVPAPAGKVQALPPAMPLYTLPGLETSSMTVNVAPPSTGPVLLSEARPYKFDFSTDLFLPALFYSSQGGLFLLNYWQGSDMLGNHTLAVDAAANTGYGGFYTYQTQYTYARYRPQFSFVTAGLVEGNRLDNATGATGYESDSTQLATMSYPLDRFHRVETLLGTMHTSFSSNDPTVANTLSDARVTGVSFVRDTVGGRWLVPTYGSRLRLSYIGAHEVLGGNSKYNTWSAIANQFVPTGGLSAFAFRLFAADSSGQDANQFFLGGLTGVRGFGSTDEANAGNRVVTTTAEWRFPIWDRLDYYMWYIFPDFYFKAITGAIFTDAGYVWSAEHDLAEAGWDSIRMSYGVGLRIHTFILQLYPIVVSFDYARPTTHATNGIFYVYLGPLF